MRMVRMPKLSDNHPEPEDDRRARLAAEFTRLQWELSLRVKGSVAARLQDAPAGVAAAIATVTPNQRAVIMAVLHEGPVAMSELARKLSISPSSATELVDRLVDHGWVQRRTAPNDRRAVVIDLTPRARSMAQEVRSLVQRGVAELLRPLGDAELSGLVATLRLLVAAEPSPEREPMDHTSDGGQPT